MNKAFVAIGAGILAVLAAVYELYALITNDVSTITEIINDAPAVVEFILVGGLMVWLAWHFGWIGVPVVKREIDRKTREVRDG